MGSCGEYCVYCTKSICYNQEHPYELRLYTNLHTRDTPGTAGTAGTNPLSHIQWNLATRDLTWTQLTGSHVAQTGCM